MRLYYMTSPYCITVYPHALCIYVLYFLLDVITWLLVYSVDMRGVSSVLVGESELVVDLADGDSSMSSKLASLNQNGVTNSDYQRTRPMRIWREWVQYQCDTGGYMRASSPVSHLSPRCTDASA